MDGFFAGMLFGIFGAAVTLTFHFDRMNRIERQAIERGYALYCPTTGDFAWKGECDD